MMTIYVGKIISRIKASEENLNGLYEPNLLAFVHNKFAF